METVLFQVNDVENRMVFLTRWWPDAIERLEADAVPRWGRMTAQQMVEHLIWALELSTGKATVSCDIPSSRRERMKAWLYDDQPSPQNFKNPKLPQDPLPLRYPSMMAAKAAFRNELDHFIRSGDIEPDVMNTHPLFGPLRMTEWERVHFKHGYHHLLQFELVREV